VSECVWVSQYVSHFQGLYVTLNVYVTRSVCVSVCLYMPLSQCVCISLSICVSVSVYDCVSLYVWVCLSVGLYMPLSQCVKKNSLSILNVHPLLPVSLTMVLNFPTFSKTSFFSFSFFIAALC